MEIVGIVAVVILIIGVFFRHIPLLKIPTSSSTVISSVTTPSPTPTPSDTPTPTLYRVKPTVTPKPTPTTTVTTQSSSSSGQNINDFRYPNGNMTSSSNSSLSLTSSDSTDTITSWYKQKIQSMHMNAKSFVTTKSNDKVLNKLVGANSTIEISVTISQENASSSVTINVNLKSSS